MVDTRIIEKLGEYRKDFAHRLDNIEKLKQEFLISNPEEIQQRIDCVDIVLDKYKTKLKALILYLVSEDYDGIVNFNYDSLSRIKLFQELSK